MTFVPPVFFVLVMFELLVDANLLFELLYPQDSFPTVVTAHVSPIFPFIGSIYPSYIVPGVDGTDAVTLIPLKGSYSDASDPYSIWN